MLNNIRVNYPDRMVLDEVHLSVGIGERVALIGGNGSGKSTLLKIIAGEQEPNEGRVEMQGEPTIGYLPQSGLYYRGRTVWEEVLTALPEWLEARMKRRVLIEKISSIPPDAPEHGKYMAQYGEMESLYQQEGGYAQESVLKRILSGLGFSLDDLNRTVEEFSAGWQMRIGLAKLLARNPDYMLLDEPTDHLDLEAKDWLEGYLKEARSGFLLVTHDRHLIDQLAEKVVEVANNKLEIYDGNYSEYLKEKNRREEDQEQGFLKQQKQIQKMETFIEGHRVRKSSARQAQSRIRQLDKIERVSRVKKKEKSFRFAFPTPSRMPRILAELGELGKGFSGDPLFHGLDLKLERWERIAVVGPNGAGKSTLLRILAGKESFQEGHRMVDEGVSIGWFSQDAGSSFSGESTVQDAILAVAPSLTQERVRGLLARFRFRGEDVFKPIEALSGGERVRLALARLLLHRHHLLLLDEPTNHLDIIGRQALLEALQAYSGTLVIVSHDRYFIQEIATRIVEINQGRVWSFLGSYEEYLGSKEAGGRQASMLSSETSAGEGADKVVQVEDAKQERIQQRGLQKEKQRREERTQKRIAGLEGEVERLEKELVLVEKEMSNPAVARDYPRLEKLHEQASEIREAIEQRYAEWENLMDEGEC